MIRMIEARAVIVLAFTVWTLSANARPAQAQSDLAHAYRIIAAKKFVDLTHSFGPQTPVWAGFGQAKFSPAADPKTHEPYTIPKDEFRATYYEMVGQYGTHVDPPAHFDEQRHHHGSDSAQADDFAAGRARRHALSRQGPEPRLLDRRSQSLGTQTWPRAGRRLRRAAHRYVQGLGQKSRTLQAQSVSRLGVRDHQISLRETRRDRDRPRSHGHRHDRQDGFGNLHPPRTATIRSRSWPISTRCPRPARSSW